MIKLYIFESVQDAQEFNSPPQETRPAAEAKVAAPPSTVPDPVSTPEKRHYKKRNSAEKDSFRERIIAKSKGAGKGHGIPHCKLCGKAGHRSNGCPTRADEPEQSDIKLTGDELHAAIQGLKEDGLDSVRIAQRLKITLKTVNENW